MRSVSDTQKDRLGSILKELLNVIEEIREEDDFYLIEQNKIDVMSWLSAVATVDNMDSLELIAESIKEKIYNFYYDDLSSHYLDSKRKELMMVFIDEIFDVVN